MPVDRMRIEWKWLCFGYEVFWGRGTWRYLASLKDDTPLPLSRGEMVVG